jgi:E3 ubiquitin-protein ligase DOA10
LTVILYLNQSEREEENVPKNILNQNEKTVELIFGSVVLFAILLLGAIIILVILLLLVWELLVRSVEHILASQHQTLSLKGREK